MRRGENSFNHILLVVAQDIKKHMLLNDSSEFVYQLSLDGLTEEKITHDEHVKAVKLLKKRGFIEADQLSSYEGPGSRPNPYAYDTPTLKLSVKANTALLDKFIDGLDKTVVSNTDKVLICQLYLNDTKLCIKIGDKEAVIGKFHDNSEPHRLMKALSSPYDVPKNVIEIFPSKPSKTNIWQILSKAEYSYLEPFFVRHSTNRLALHREIELSVGQLELLVSEINENYRKNAKDIIEKIDR